uniref:RRM domain-containing protein n=1 Tax=Aegilops tauschii subsp. strangulata TaxID=200361 RepID=A0A453T8P5_AEGTS
SDGSASGQPNRRRRNGFNQGRRRMGVRPRRTDREDSVRRTVYVSDIDQHVTEQKLAEVFSNCGQVVDCRICGDPNSVMRFAFIEFADDAGARAALTLGGTILGFYPVRVLPSKTAILPVNPKFLPRTEDEKEMVSRTVYCTNIDKNVCCPVFHFCYAYN